MNKNKIFIGMLFYFLMVPDLFAQSVNEEAKILAQRSQTFSILIGIVAIFSIVMTYFATNWIGRPMGLPITDQQKEEISAAFKKKQRLMNWYNGFGLVLYAILVFFEKYFNHLLNGLSPDDAYHFFLVFVVLLLIPAFGMFRMWRCPACNGFLGRVWFPISCPHCGVKL